MGLFSKKNDVPSELPDLGFEEVVPELSKEAMVRSSTLVQHVEDPLKASTDFKGSQQANFTLAPPSPVVQAPAPAPLPQEDEKGFFKDILKTVTQDLKTTDQLSTWYEHEMLRSDVVEKMRDYWEKQKPHMALNTVSKELKTRLLQRTDALHTLEKQWQELYFSLLAKEEEIRDEEKGLKEALSEFVDLYKGSLKKVEEGPN